MSSYNYKYIKIDSNTGKSEYKIWKNTSFWQSNIWANILQKTHQAQDIFVCFSDTHAVLLERRTIFRNYTGLYILGIERNLINPDLLAFIQSNISTSNDLFLQIEPLEKVHSTKYCSIPTFYRASNSHIKPQNQRRIASHQLRRERTIQYPPRTKALSNNKMD